MIPLSNYLILSAILFSIGIFGILTKRNAIIVLMSIEIMLNSINLNFVAFSVYNGTIQGQAFALFSIGIGAAEVAVGLAIFLALYRCWDKIDVSDMKLLRW